MEYTLKNGKNIIIRKPALEDAEGIVNLISVADRETKFLSRNPDEFSVTTEQEKLFISEILNDDNSDWFVAEYEGKIIGHCSVGLVSKNERLRHRAEVTFVVLKDYWGLGIGKLLMEQCIDQCKNKRVSQIELEVVSDNERAINLYKNFGFKITGTIPKAMRYPDNTFADKSIMVLEL